MAVKEYNMLKDWQRLDKLLQQAIIPVVLFPIFYIISIFVGSGESPVEEFFGGRIIFIVIILVILPLCLYYLISLYRLRLHRWVKVYEIGNQDMANMIENILRNNKLPFRKLSHSDDLPRFPIGFIEVFDIDDGRITIGVQKSNNPFTTVDIGPIQEGKEIETLGIDVLREKIDKKINKRRD